MVIVAVAGYGQTTAFPHGLAERGLDYVVAVRSDESRTRRRPRPVHRRGAGTATIPPLPPTPPSAPRLATAGVRSSAGVVRGW
ncbi:transposase [Streptomyces sp. NPDC002587]